MVGTEEPHLPGPRQQQWEAMKPPPGTAATGLAPKPLRVAVFSAVAACFCPYCTPISCSSSGVNNEQWGRGGGVGGESGFTDLFPEATARLPEASLAGFLRPAGSHVVECTASRSHYRHSPEETTFQ